MNKTSELLAALRSEIQDLPSADLPAIIGQVEAVKAEAFARMMAPLQTSDDEKSSPDRQVADRLVDVRGAAVMLGQTERWVRDHQRELPRVNLPGRTVRFSENRLAAFIRRRSYS